MAAIATLVYGAALGASRVCDEMGESSQHHGCFVVALATAVGSLYCQLAFWAKNILKDLRSKGRPTP